MAQTAAEARADHEPTEKLIDVVRVAEILGVKPKWVYGAVERGAIPFIRLPGSFFIRFRESEIREWLVENEHGPRKPRRRR